MANEVGLGFLTVKRLLNHAFEGGVTGGYVVPGFNPDKEREYFQKVGDYMLDRRAEYLGQKRKVDPNQRLKILIEIKRKVVASGIDPTEVTAFLNGEKIGAA